MSGAGWGLLGPAGGPPVPHASAPGYLLATEGAISMSRQVPRADDHEDTRPVLTRLKELEPVRALGRRAVIAMNEREKRRPPAPRRAGAWALERLRLLDSIPEAELVALEKNVTVDSHPRRHTWLLSDAGSQVWVVLSGGVKLCRVSALGQRLVEALLEPGDVFGRVSPGGGEPVTYELQSLETTRIAALPRPEFEALLRRHPGLAYAVVQTLEDRQRKLVRRIEGLVFKDVRARVAETLLELVREHGHACAHGFAVDVRITQQDLADLVGASRQMVNRVIGELSRELYVHRSGRVICVLHRERLQRLAEQA
jgi:CRP/FNR family transcriptional regulator, cyclic AMP receptor protein